MADYWGILQVAGLVVWLAGAVFFLIQLGVFSPQSLAAAPTRESSLSLPIIGAVIVVYLIMQVASALAAVGLGALPSSELTPPAAATAPATATTSAPATSTMPTGIPEADRIVVYNAISLACAILTAIPVLLVLPRLFKHGFAGWGLHPRQLPGGAGRGFFGFFLFYPLFIVAAVVLMNIYAYFQHHPSEHSTFEAMDQHISLARQLFLCFTAIIVAPLSEELFFRGIIQTTLIQRGWGFLVPQMMPPGSLPLAYRPSAAQRWTAIFVTSAAFAYVHQADQRPLIFLLSLALGYVYERTGSLWAPMALHMAFNSTEITAYFTS